MKYRIVSRGSRETVATFGLDPYRFNMRSGLNGLRLALESIEELQQMNRTAGGEVPGVDEGDGDDEDDVEQATSPETYQSPSPDFVLNYLGDLLRDGYVIVNDNEKV